MTITFKVSDVPLNPFSGAPYKVKKNFLQGSEGVSGKQTYVLGQNSFVNVVLVAYVRHHNLVISPDDVWISLMVQFSFYLNANSEALRHQFVDFEGKKKLVVELDSIKLLKDLPYDKITQIFEEQIAKNIKDPSVRKWVVPDFSTTTPTERVVGSVVLMTAMKTYFDYEISAGCDLPSVSILGTPEDWKEIRFRAERFKEFDLG